MTHQNSRYQNTDKEQGPYWRSTNIRHHHSKFSHPGDLDLCTPGLPTLLLGKESPSTHWIGQLHHTVQLNTKTQCKASTRTLLWRNRTIYELLFQINWKIGQLNRKLRQWLLHDCQICTAVTINRYLIMTNMGIMVRMQKLTSVLMTCKILSSNYIFWSRTKCKYLKAVGYLNLPQDFTMATIYMCGCPIYFNFNTMRTGSFKLFKRPFPGFLTILTL